MGKMNKLSRYVVNYEEVFRSTRVTYWPRFIKHTYCQKKNRISVYERTPEKLAFRYLPVNEQYILTCISKYSAQIVAEADGICQGNTRVFNLLTRKIEDQWSTDPLTGYEWPLIFYADVRKITPQGTVENKNDIKYPWELSNSHHLVILAEAFALTRDEKYRKEYLRLLENWIEKNPVGMGVNWCCTMDVALRAINIIVSASILEAVDRSFERDFLKFYNNLYSHMLFIRDNLEYGFVRENHYLSDITGLKMLAQCFQGDKKADKILKLARKSFREEICYQVYEDGADHEASTCYHCFVLELFTIGLATDETLRKELSEREYQRLSKMTAFSEMLCSFAQYPIIGDNDSGRVLDLNGTGAFRKDILTFAHQVFGQTTEEQSVYSFLILGEIMPYLSQEHSEREITIYEKSGFATLRNERVNLLIHSGNIGRKGKGGHGHNDISSFVMDVDGMSFIIDPGSAVYERDLRIRHRFRNTAAHNCVFLNEMEQNHISIQKPFKMDHDTKATVIESNDAIMCCHIGYLERLGVKNRREIRWKQNTLFVDDYLEGNNSHPFSCYYTFAEDVVLEKNGAEIRAMIPNRLDITVIIPENCCAVIVDGEYSPDYGVIKKTSGLLITCSIPTEHIQIAFKIK